MSKDIIELSNEIQELQSLFEELNNQVHNQSKDIQTISDIIEENKIQNIVQTETELQKADGYETNYYWYGTMLGTTILFVMDPLITTSGIIGVITLNKLFSSFRK